LCQQNKKKSARKSTATAVDQHIATHKKSTNYCDEMAVGAAARQNFRFRFAVLSLI